MYVEYKAVSGVFKNIENIDPPPPLHPASVSSSRTKRWGVQTRRAVRGRGSIFWKTPDIGLASYNIISLRSELTLLCETVRQRTRAGPFKYLDKYKLRNKPECSETVTYLGLKKRAGY
jgi:hypothetical protein